VASQTSAVDALTTSLSGAAAARASFDASAPIRQSDQ
jgi:hypothetical protein